MTPEHLSWRRGDGTPDQPTLGATDCAAVLAHRLGWHTFRGPAEIYAERWHGRRREDPLDPKTFFLRLGHLAEPELLARWHLTRGYALPDPKAPPMRLQTAAYPWWRGSPDAPPVDGWIVDSKTTHYQALGHWYTATGAPCWPGVYLAQLAQYAVVARAAGHHVDRIALAFADLSSMDGTLHERTAALSDPVSDHIDPDLPIPTDADGAPLTVEALGLAALALGAAFRSAHLLGDTPPCPPPDGPVAAWWAAKPRPRPSSRPATRDEAAAIADYLAALTAGQEADAAKTSARAEIARLMSGADPVARIYCDVGSASIGEKGGLTIKAAK